MGCRNDPGRKPSPAGATRYLDRNHSIAESEPAMTYWSNSQLTEWRASIPTDFPEWRRELYENTRKQNCPTFAEARERLRRDVREFLITPLRKAPHMPKEWLKPAGICRLKNMIRDKRIEHTALIKQEKVNRP